MNQKQKLHFYISFDRSWVLTQRGKDVLPVDWLVNELKAKYKISDVESRKSYCEGIIEIDVNSSKESIQENLCKLITENYQIEKDEVFEIELEEISETQNIAEKNDNTEISQENVQESEKPSEKIKAAEKKPVDDIKTDDVIESLVGAEEFKALADECTRMAQTLKATNTLDTFASRTYVISINDGCGLTTCLEAFAEHLKKLGLFKFTTKQKIKEVKLESPGSRNDNSYSLESSCFYETGKIICIDISEWMTNLSDKEFRDFLRVIDEHIGENIVFFRVPFVEQNIINGIVASINDILFVRKISVPPFSIDELIQCAECAINEKGFSMDEDAWDVFKSRIISEKSDGRFYGINTVNKIVRELLYVKQLFNVDNGIDSKLIKKEEICSLVDSDNEYNLNGYEKLSKMIGMETICEKVKEIVAQIETSTKNKAIDTPCIHMRFTGNPGTGKTTVARIIGEILKERGILRNGSFFEHSGRSLCGRYVGETAPKTASICRDAYGSVLFIDEAYSLYRDDGISHADYGREAIDTLVAEMENHRTDLMVIMAGYPDEMDKLMNGNAGLKSRMPYLIEFPNYSREQLAEIFMSMVGKAFKYDDSFSDAVQTYFQTLSSEILNAKDFSNARFVRNLFERTWGKAALRCQMNQIVCDTLIVEDFVLATSDKEFHNIIDKKKQKIGFN